MEFNTLLAAEGIAPGTVALALHKATGGVAGTRALCALASEDEAGFVAMQSTHPKIQQATLMARRYMASFVPGAPGEMRFVGLYEVLGWHVATREELENDDDFVRMYASLGRCDRTEGRRLAAQLAGRLRFEQRLVPAFADLRGRLSVRDPAARNFMRLAEKTPLPVIEIARVKRLAPEMPPWDRLVLGTDDLQDLPKEWALRLSDWRGVYMIVDMTDGARYIGSAYGADNLLGRWRTHVAGEVGVTVELKARKPRKFRFSILERLSPDAEPQEVIAREMGWIERLGTREWGLNT